MNLILTALFLALGLLLTILVIALGKAAWLAIKIGNRFFKSMFQSEKEKE